MKWLLLVAIVTAIALGGLYHEEIERSLAGGSPKVRIPVVQSMGSLKGAISKSMNSVGDMLGR